MPSRLFAFDGFTRPQDGSKRAQESPYRGQREPQDGSKSAQERLKRSPRGDDSGYRGAALVNYPPSLIDLFQDGPKMASGDPKSAPRGPQEAPRRPQEAPKIPPRGPQEALKRPESMKKLKENLCLLPPRLFASDGLPRPQDYSKRAPRGAQDGHSSPSGTGVPLLLICIHPLPHSTGVRPGTMTTPPRHPCRELMRSTLCGKSRIMRGHPAITLHRFLTGTEGGGRHSACCAQPSYPCQRPMQTHFAAKSGSCAGAPRSLCIF